MTNIKASEKQIQSAIIQHLNWHGCWVWRTNAGNIPMYDKRGKKRMIKVGVRGTPDISGIHKATGKHIGIEIKTPKRKDKVTFAQWEHLKRIKEYNGISGVATSPEEALQIIHDQAEI